MQNWFNLAKSINKIHYINSIKEKHPVFISIDAEKVFNKVHHPVRIKSLSKTKIEENFLYQIQVTYKKKPHSFTMLNGKILNVFHIA